MRALPTGTITFLFTDIEGSTKLWEQYPDVMLHAHARHLELIIHQVEAHGGVFVRTRGEGDSTFSVFSVAPDALAAVTAIQCAFGAERWPDQTPLRVRAALHTGTAVLRNEDYNSSDVNRCARLRAIAHGGQTILSQTVYNLVYNSLPPRVTLRDMGEHRLKDLATPEHVYQVLHPYLPTEFQPLASLDPLRHNLPVQTTSFVGRKRELDDIAKLLPTTRLLTLVGVAGCGKTRLMLQAAADLIEQYSQGIWLVELGSLADPTLVSQVVAQALSIREEMGQTLTQSLITFVKPKQMLLLLDNCEHLVTAVAQLADTLLRACPSLTILATSREDLRIPGELLHRLQPLSLPNTDRLLSVEALIEYEAIALFCARTRSHQPTFQLTRANAATVEQICQCLDGIPLALELAAARIRSMPVQEIATRLKDRFQLLTDGSRAALPRQQTLRALIDWSYDLLSQEQRALLCRLSVFAGSWSAEAAEAVCSSETGECIQIFYSMLELVDKSLVVYEERNGQGRYRLLEVIKQYCWERLNERNEEPTMRQQHSKYFLSLAEQAEPNLQGAEQAVWLDRLDLEHDNLRVAQAFTDNEFRLRFVQALWWFWYVRGYLSEGYNWAKEALDRADPAPTLLRARALHGAAVLAGQQGKHTEALRVHELSLTMFRTLGDGQGAADALNSMGIMARRQGNYADARILYEESLAIRRNIGDKRGIARSLTNMGIIACQHDEYDTARAYYDEGAALYREINDLQGLATLLTNLGHLAGREHDLTKARHLFEESLIIKRKIGNKDGIAISAMNLADVARMQEDYEAMWPLLEECLLAFRKLGDRQYVAYALETCAAALTVQEQPETAAQLFGAAAALREEINAPLQPDDREEYEHNVEVVHSALGNEAFLATWHTGRAMLVEEALECALRKASHA